MGGNSSEGGVPPDADGVVGPHYHYLRLADIDDLAVGVGGRDTIQRLAGGERSRRVLLLRHLLDRAAARPESLLGLPSAEEAWRALQALRESAPAALFPVLMHPQVGTWLASTIRVLAGAARAHGPIWAEVGQIHALAFAAAVRGGQEFGTRVPVRDGRVLLPTLGLATVDRAGTWGVADAHTADGLAVLRTPHVEIELPANPTTNAVGWWGLRHLSAHAKDTSLRVFLDDIDPYRDLSEPVPPHRLTDEAVRHWAGMLEDAWELLAEEWPEYAAGISAGLASICPLPDDPHSSDVRSASTGDAFGSALMTTVPDATTFAVTLVHEFQHIKLGGLLHLVPLHKEEESGELFYAPWRDDPRPLPGLLQGAYAFLGISEFWWRHWNLATDHREAELAALEFGCARRQTWSALLSIGRSSALTELGTAFVRGMTARMRDRMRVRIPLQIEREARAVLADHRAVWHLRNRVPSPLLVQRLVVAWRSGHSAQSVDPSVLSDGALVPVAGHVVHSRLGLRRTRLLTPDRFADLVADPAGARLLAPADIALVAGEPGNDAFAQFRQRVAVNPEDISAWAGLGLAAAADARPCWRPLLRRPELVKATYQVLRQTDPSVDPVEVAAWLGQH